MKTILIKDVIEHSLSQVEMKRMEAGNFMPIKPCLTHVSFYETHVAAKAIAMVSDSFVCFFVCFVLFCFFVFATNDINMKHVQYTMWQITNTI